MIGTLALLAFAAILAAIIHFAGQRPYIEPPRQQAARHWEDLVWDHAVWVNPETPEQGIDRLAGPHRKELS